MLLVWFSSIFLLTGSVKLQKNVLLVVLDDFRPAIKSGYDDFRAHTPNLDSFIKKSALFKRIYAQQALCAPSRNSFLTSRRPDSLRLYDFNSYWRTFVDNFTTLPQYFKDHGYFTKSIGKVFHPGISSNFTDDFPKSWSEPTYHPSTEEFMNKPVCIDASGEMKKNLLCPIELMFSPQKTLPDIQSMIEAKNFLKIQKTTPFFLAVGFHKPHIPFKFPLKYLDLHPIKNFNESTFRPFNVPVAWNPYNDVRARDDVQALNLSFPYGPIDKNFASQIRQHYYASISYVDDLIGELFKAVNFSDTIIIITSDHGWSLGEHEEWAKYSNYEVALNVPLIIFDPDNPEFGGKAFSTIGELLDLFPTLVELARLPIIPKCHEKSLTCTEGKSLVPYMMEIAKDSEDDVAFSQFPRPSEFPSKNPNSDKPKLNQIKIMGYSIRTPQYRYTVWIKFTGKTFQKNWTKVYGEELYDHSFDAKENLNLAYNDGFSNIKFNLKQRILMNAI